MLRDRCLPPHPSPCCLIVSDENIKINIPFRALSCDLVLEPRQLPTFKTNGACDYSHNFRKTQQSFLLGFGKAGVSSKLMSEYESYWVKRWAR